MIGMAKQEYGILDGYRGSVGPVIGYQWRGRWCLRARPRQVRNPQTEAQQAHRMLFRDMVRLAGRMNQALRFGLREASLEAGLTECNLFVKTNKDRFTAAGVDYGALELSSGPVAPVAFTRAEIDGGMTLHAEFEKNPLHLRADAYDKVLVYAFCPAQQRGVLSAPVYRRSRCLEMSLPDEWADHEVHLYAFVTDHAQRASSTLYLGTGCNAGAVPATVDLTAAETSPTHGEENTPGSLRESLAEGQRRDGGGKNSPPDNNLDT